MRSISIKTWFLTIALLVSLAGLYIVERSSEVPDWKDIEILFLFAFVTFPLLTLLHKSIMIDQIKRWMFASSEEIESELPDVFKNQEHPATVQPEICEFDLISVPYSSAEQREKVIGQALVVLKRRWRTGAITCLVYITLTFLMGLLSGENFTGSWSLVIVIIAIYFVLITLSYFINQLDFQPRYESFGGSFTYFKLVVIAAKALLNPQLDIVLWFIFGGWMIYLASSKTGITLFSIGVYISVAVHLVLLVRLWRAPHEGPNIKLLVLRVFDSIWTSVLTFDKLIKYWRKFGVYITIDDPGYAKHRYRFFQLRTLVELSAFTILAASISAFSRNSWLALLLFLAWAGYDWFELLNRKPVLNQEHAHQRIQKVLARPRYNDGSFRDLRMSAFMNTWKLIVDEFVNVADVVLFDLREYSEQRAGAQYEVNFLFDTFPVHKIVFLRSKNSDKNAIHRLILNSWAAMREGSPNMNITDPVIRIYVNSKQNADEVQGLMDMLLSAANES